MLDPDHYIIATFIGKNNNRFKVGTQYLLRVEFRGVGIYPINVVFDYAQHYTSVPYRHILDFLKDWTEIFTVVDPKLVDKSKHVLYEDSSENELPFKFDDTEDVSEYEAIKREVKPPVKMGRISTELMRIPKPVVFSNGSWVCPNCKHVNRDAASVRCEVCKGGRISFSHDDDE
jgi:hypothetical protein